MTDPRGDNVWGTPTAARSAQAHSWLPRPALRPVGSPAGVAEPGPAVDRSASGRARPHPEDAAQLRERAELRAELVVWAVLAGCALLVLLLSMLALWDRPMDAVPTSSATGVGTGEVSDGP